MDIIIGLLVLCLAVVVLSVLEGPGVWPWMTGISFIMAGIYVIPMRAKLDRELGRGAGIAFSIFMLALGLVFLAIGISNIQEKK